MCAPAPPSSRPADLCDGACCGLCVCQVVILAVQIWWSSGVEASLSTASLPAGPERLKAPLDGLTARLLTSVQRVLTDANTQVRHPPLFDRCLRPLTDALEARHDVRGPVTCVGAQEVRAAHHRVRPRARRRPRPRTQTGTCTQTTYLRTSGAPLSPHAEMHPRSREPACSAGMYALTGHQIGASMRCL